MSRRERVALRRYTIEKRRSDWRLGRFAAKAAASSWLRVEPAQVEVLAAPDGAPVAHVGGEPAPVAVSLSHRAGRALAVAGPAAAALGSDLELLEPRSGAFVREWLASPDRGLLETLPPPRRSLAANLMWTAKEAAAKARREGLRLDVRQAAVRAFGVSERREGWRRLEVRWDDGEPIEGWWREEPEWVMAVVADPPPEAPRPLA